MVAPAPMATLAELTLVYASDAHDPLEQIAANSDAEAMDFSPNSPIFGSDSDVYAEEDMVMG